MDIKNLINSITESNIVQHISLADCPMSNPYPQLITEKIESIISEMQLLRKYVKNEDDVYGIVQKLWSYSINEFNGLSGKIGDLQLKNGLTDKNKKTYQYIREINGKEFEKENADSAKIISEIQKNLDKIISDANEIIQGIWLAVKSIDGITFNAKNPTIQQIYIFSFLLPNAKLSPKDGTTGTPSVPRWDALCDKVKSCFCDNASCVSYKIISAIAFSVLCLCLGVCAILNLFGIFSFKDNSLRYFLILINFVSAFVAIIWMFYKYLHFEARECERMAKLKEKVMDNIIASFNEDRENAMLWTKTSISLYEKREKARIEEWERNKENERKMNICEQERIAKFSDVLLELAKTHNKFVIKYGPQNNVTEKSGEISILT